jgi:hypothetical protein
MEMEKEAKMAFVIGLANDEIGYNITKSVGRTPLCI